MEFINQLGGLSYLGVFGISMLAMIVLPFPEEITLVSFGYLAGVGVFHWALLIPVCMAGLFVADFAVYQLAYHGSKITTKFYQKMFADKFDFLQNMTDEKLERLIIFARFLIYFRFLSGFLSGYYKIPFKRFVGYELVSLSVYVTLFVGIGFFLRNQLERVIEGVGIVQNIILVLVLITVGTMIFRSLKKYLIQNGKQIAKIIEK
jgi:membrane protein DedA with SNARE-associated domain